MTDLPQGDLYLASEEFHRARRAAGLEQAWARLTGRSAELLEFEEVRQQLRATGTSSQGLREIPLDAIVGSVGRYRDFTRSFLPRNPSDRERWARVHAATGLGQFDPIEVYQIGDAYFVVDGNHRVSIARQHGSKTISAYVTQVQTKVPLSAGDQPDDLILKAELADFLERTNLDTTRPGADLRVTVPDRYPEFLEHITVHQYYMSEGRDEVPFEEAAAHWYDAVYLPVVEAIQAGDLLRDFPNRTEADLYIWLARHRAALEEALGWTLPPVAAATNLATQHSPRAGRVVARLGERLRRALTPTELGGGPEAGQWRRGRVAARGGGALFQDILVPLSGEEVSWQALDQALVIAAREGSRLLGLHVIPAEVRMIQEATKAVEAEFMQRVRAAGVRGEFVFEVGLGPARRIAERAQWADLVIVSLSYPPVSATLPRLRSGFRALVRHCPRPLLAAPGRVSLFARPLLAYDGSPKSDEALIVAAHLAAAWGAALQVLTVTDLARGEPEALTQARTLLEGEGIRAIYHHSPGPTAATILRHAEALGADGIIVGSYGREPVTEAVLGSAVDPLLRDGRFPLLICR